MGDHEGTLQTEYDVTSMKTKPVLTRFGRVFGILSFDENSLPKILLGFTQYCNSRLTNAILVDSPYVCTSEKFINISTKDKTQFKDDATDGSVVSVLIQPNI